MNNDFLLIPVINKKMFDICINWHIIYLFKSEFFNGSKLNLFYISGSQELNRSQVAPPPISSKFNSLDRRSLGQRSCRGLQQTGPAHQNHQTIPSNGLRLSTWSGYDAGSSTSLPPVGITPVNSVQPPRDRERDPVRNSKEPERRHSLYDSASRGRTNSITSPNSNSSNNNQNISAMNVNGLPEPFGPPLSRPPSTSHIGEPRTRHSGAGTPQFRKVLQRKFFEDLCVEGSIIGRKPVW